FFASRRRHTRSKRDWSSDVCSSDLERDNEEDLTLGELELAERNAFRRVTHRTEIRHTDAEDIYEVEYRKLRLERVILVGVWIEEIGRASCREGVERTGRGGTVELYT